MRINESISIIEVWVRSNENSSKGKKFLIPDEGPRSEIILASILKGIDRSDKLNEGVINGIKSYIDFLTEINKIRYEEEEKEDTGQKVIISVEDKEVICFNIGFMTKSLTNMFPGWRFELFIDTHTMFPPEYPPLSDNVMVHEYNSKEEDDRYEWEYRHPSSNS